MIRRIFFNCILIYLISIGGNALSAQTIFPAPLPANAVSGDSTPIVDSAGGPTANSLKSDLIRSAVGTAIGGFVGAAIGGMTPILFGREYDSGFPDNSFYLSSYLGASFFAALSSSGGLYLSKNRDISYWRLAGYSLLPPMIVVLPLSVYASANDREELVRSTWVATMASLGITAAWNVLVYRMHPLKESSGYRIHFGKLYPYRTSNQMSPNESIGIGVSIVEIRF